MIVTLDRIIKVCLIICLFSNLSLAQKNIKGVVRDANSMEPLIGVNVIIPGTTLGTSTDFDGNYSIDVGPDITSLEFSYIGYQTKTVEIGGNSSLDVLLSSGEALSEIVYIGYGTMKKSDKTGAISLVKADELNMGRLSDPIQGLQGKAAGVTVSKQGGDPNAGFAVNIRGASSFLSGTGPLYIVDGVPGVDPTTLSPNDIASFNVLKDAASTSIYGARGANGVVIITTKNSSISDEVTENTRIEYSGQFSFDNVANKLDLLSGQEIRDFANNTNSTFIDNGASIDWQDEVYRSGFSQDHTLSFTSSGKNSAYRASFSHLDLTGVINGSAKTRNIGRLNYSNKALNDRLTINARLSGTIEHNDYVNYGGGSSPNNVIYQMIRRSPTDPVRNEDGSFFETDRSFQYFNPIAIINDVQNERDAKRLLGNFNFSLDLGKGLSATTNLAYLRDDDESFYFEPTFTASNQSNGFARRSYNNKVVRILESTMNYAETLKDNHNLNLVGGYSYQIEGYDGFHAQGENASSDYIQSYNLGAILDLEDGSIGAYKNEAILISFFGRAVYDYKKKYLLTGSLRRDGSSKFGSGNEWGWFPSVTAGWNILGESFMANHSFFDQLKLRVGYGVTGNQDIPINADKTLFTPDGRAINPETGETVTSFVVSGGTNPNPNLKWEENQELNLGLDFAFLDSRISGSIEVYNKKTIDLIYGFQVPVPPNKQRTTIANAGEISNKGIEATIQAFPYDGENLDWKTIFTFSKNSQETIKLGNDEFELGEIPTLYVSGRGLVGGINNAQVIREGLAIGTFVLPEFAGLSEDGKPLFYTESGGVTRLVDKAERRVVGSAQPDFSIGWSNFFDIGKSFDFSFALRAVVGYDVLNVTRMVFSNPADLPTLNTLSEALDEYEKGLNSSPILSDYYLEDATFLRLDNVSIGYTLPVKNNKYLKGLRFSVTGTNLFLLTDYSGIDPEISYGGSEFGRDQYDVYPKTRTISIGVNAKF